jgi:hypothetical protein
MIEIGRVSNEVRVTRPGLPFGEMSWHAFQILFMSCLVYIKILPTNATNVQCFYQCGLATAPARSLK